MVHRHPGLGILKTEMKIPCSTFPVQSPIARDLCKRYPFTPSLRPFQLKCSVVLFPAAILSSLLFQSMLNGMYIYVDVADPRWVPYRSWLQIITMKIKFPNATLECERTMPYHARRCCQSVDSRRAPCSDTQMQNKAGRRRLLIRIVANAVVVRAWRVHVAVAAQLLRRIGSMGTEDVVDALFLSWVGRCTRRIRLPSCARTGCTRLRRLSAVATAGSRLLCLSSLRLGL